MSLVFVKLTQSIGFNSYTTFPGRKCSVPNCLETAYCECVGILIPDSLGELNLPKTPKPVQEIFSNAKQILDGGPAIDRLTVFLKTKIIPSQKSFTSDKIIRHHARLILEKLKIDDRCTLSDHDKDRILRELQLYPSDWL